MDTELSPDDVSHSNQRAVDAYNNYMREAGNIVGRLEEIQATSAQSLLSFMYWLLVYLITFRVGSTATVLKLATKQLAKAKAAVVNDRLGNP